MQQRQEILPQAIRDIAWKAQVRLCKRYRRLVAKGKHPTASWWWRSHASSRRSCGPSPGKCPLRLIMPRPGEPGRGSWPDSLWTRRECPQNARTVWTSGWTRSLLPAACPHSFTPGPHCAGKPRPRCVPDRPLQQSFDKTTQGPAYAVSQVVAFYTMNLIPTHKASGRAVPGADSPRFGV